LTTPTANPRRKSRFWRLCRIYFRRFRIAVWLVLLVLVSGLVYLNQVGLPGLLKKPLVEALHARGLDLQFSRLRLSYSRGIVAENVRFGRADDPETPSLTVREIRVALNHRALTRFHLQVESLLLRQGRLVWPVATTNNAPRQLVVDNIQSNLRLLPGDEWALDNLRASFGGANFLFMGRVTHASAVAQWKFPKAKEPTPAGLWQNRIRVLADLLEQIQFSSPPDFKLDVRGDASEVQSFSVRLMVSAQGATTPWGTFSQARFTARLFPAENSLTRAAVTLDADDAVTPWASTTNLHLNLHLLSEATLTNLVNADLHLETSSATTRWASGKGIKMDLQAEIDAAHSGPASAKMILRADAAQSEWGSAKNARIAAEWRQDLTNAVPLEGTGELECDDASSLWASAGHLKGSGRFSRSDTEGQPVDPSLGIWGRFQPYTTAFTVTLSDLQATNIIAKSVTFSGAWSPPALTLSNFVARLYGGELNISADLNAHTRRLQAQVNSDTDPHRLNPVLPLAARAWLGRYTWNSNPVLRAEASLTLPPWTNRSPDWSSCLPSLRLAGQARVEHGGSYSNIPISSVQTHFSYSNQCWRLPDLLIHRPEGQVLAVHEADELSKDYYWKIDSHIDPHALNPLLSTEAQKGLELLTVTSPPHVQAEVWSNYQFPERTGVRGQVALTNFTFRGESFSTLNTQIAYSNLVLTCLLPRAERGTQQLSADGLQANFQEQRIYLTNGFSTAEPMVVARAIGPHIGKTIEPYRFLHPPTVHAAGVIPMQGEEDADLRFELDGGPFQWHKFNVSQIRGVVDWKGLKLSLEKIRAAFYGGSAGGDAHFQFREGGGADYTFKLNITNSQLHTLMSDLGAPSNRIEGILSGTLGITRANTEKGDDVDGYGYADLKDGLIWDIPVFGLLSPVLNGIAPGLGNSRAKAATCSFIITNGFVFSDDLEVRSAGFRLQYRGTANLAGEVNARVEASLLRDIWLLGPVFSTVFWPVTKMFEYKVTGPITNPKSEPVYIVPKVVLFPLQPFKTLRDLIPEETPERGTGPPKP
jgi:hypothetical protein